MVASTRITSKAELERALAYFDKVRPRGRRDLEQYPTPVELAAHIIWVGRLKGDIEGTTVADFGCGDGRLAVASLLAGSSRALCIEIDESMLEHGMLVVEKYFEELQGRIIHVLSDATRISLNNVDTVVTNPPFGVVRKNRGLDLRFLVNALRNSKSVYSIHKYSEGFVKLLHELARSWSRNIVWLEVLNLGIPMIYERHKRKVYRIKSVFIALLARWV